MREKRDFQKAVVDLDEAIRIESDNATSWSSGYRLVYAHVPSLLTTIWKTASSVNLSIRIAVLSNRMIYMFFLPIPKKKFLSFMRKTNSE